MKNNITHGDEILEQLHEIFFVPKLKFGFQ